MAWYAQETTWAGDIRGTVTLQYCDGAQDLRPEAVRGELFVVRGPVDALTHFFSTTTRPSAFTNTRYRWPSSHEAT